jgi:hypothetical protein
MELSAGQGDLFRGMGQRDTALSAVRESSASSGALMAAIGSRFVTPQSPLDCAGYVTTLLSQGSTIGPLLGAARQERVARKSLATIAVLNKEYSARHG